MFRVSHADHNRAGSALAAYCAQARAGLGARAAIAAERARRLKAERLAEAKSKFISMMSHELRTPLNSIVGFSEILATQGDGLDDGERIRFAQLINGSGRHLAAVVTDILEMSKLQSGTQSVHPRSIGLANMLEEIVATLQLAADSAGVRLDCTVEPPAIEAFVDETKFAQSVRNVVDNAIKFTGRGGRVSLDARPGEDGRVVVSVSDTGTGMDAQELEVALTPFGQAGPALNGETEGTGLGLCIARELTELQGGRFSIRSTKGEGTVVRFAMRACEEAGGTPREARDGAGAARAGGGDDED